MRERMPKSINFREHSFDPQVDKIIEDFKAYFVNLRKYLDAFLDEEDATKHILESVNKMLNDLYDGLLNYCENNGNNQTVEDVLDETNLIFSQFLQHAIYFISHVAIKKENKSHLVLISQIFIELLNKKIIAYKGDDEISLFFHKVWIDPKTGFSAFTAICENNLKLVFEPMIKSMERAFETIEEMRDLFLHQNHAGFGALQAAVINGRTNLFKRIINEAIQLFYGCASKSFRKFTKQLTQQEQNLLHLAVLSKNPMMVLAVLDLIKTYDYGKDRIHYLFFFSRNSKGYTPYELAVHLRDEYESDSKEHTALAEIASILEKHEPLKTNRLLTSRSFFTHPMDRQPKRKYSEVTSSSTPAITFELISNEPLPKRARII